MRLWRNPMIWLGLTILVHWSAAGAPLQIDYAQSRIEVAVRSTSGSFKGKLQHFEAAIDCEPQARLPSKATVNFDFKDLKTGINGRDNHMHKWLQYSKTPTGSFRLQSWEKEGGESIAVGELTLHGITRQIRSPVTVKREEARYAIDGVVGLDYRDFGLPIIRTAALFTVNPHLKIVFHLSGKLENPK